MDVQIPPVLRFGPGDRATARRLNSSMMRIRYDGDRYVQDADMPTSEAVFLAEGILREARDGAS